ncbi:DUF3987 domain-containing protein [Vibrio sonorensis]|uniref:DUF3987 domain-containing protein n=1 Tax=Vibrio sonorensis TaxID=1004316 RepID=UPI0008D9603C|nr:DUF3987 domain-containing protein [Vibrio sonorensis]
MTETISVAVVQDCAQKVLTTGRDHNQTNGFSLISLTDLEQAIRNPVDLTKYQPDENQKLRQAKAHCPWFLPSDIGTSKRKNDLESHSNYTMLVADIDDGNSEINAIEGDLELNGIDSYLIYSTMSSKPDDKRWRVVVPISQPVDLDHWQALQATLVVSLNGDDCTSRSQQISYLPALSVFNKECYQYTVESKQPLDVFNSYFAEQAALLSQEQAREAEEQAAKVKPAKQSPISLAGGQISPITTFNQVNDWSDLLSGQGYKKRGKKWLHPDSTSGLAGVLISYRDDVNGRYISSHGSDPLSDGFSHDKFDFYCLHEHSGNREAALIQVGNDLKNQDGLSITQHNQKAHVESNQAIAIQAANQEFKNLDKEDSTDEWRQPEPLVSELNPVAKFCPELLPEQVRNYVTDYSYRMDKAPTDFAAISVIICAGALIGGSAEIQPKRLDTGWRIVPTMWGGAVGQPSTKKTPSLNCGRKLLEHSQKSVIDKLNAEKVDLYELELQLSEEEADKAKDKAKEALAAGNKQEALQIQRQARSSQPKPPKIRKVMINDSTSEALAIRLEANPLGALMFRDELSSWLANMERADRQHERGFYLEGFNGSGSYSQERVTRKNIELERVILSVMGGIQPAKLTPLLTGKANGTGDDGLLERIMQIMVYPDFSGMEYVDKAPDVMAEMTAKSTFDALAYLGERELPLICKFDNDAQNLWESWAKNLVHRKNTSTAQWQSMIGKYDALCAKLALVFHLIEEAGSTLVGEEPEPSAVIAIQHLERAIKWMEYLESHANRIMTYFDAEKALAPAKTLLDRLPQISPMFTRHVLSQKDWKGLTSKETREEALNELVKRGFINEVSVPPASGRGRPTVQFWVHPDYRN